LTPTRSQGAQDGGEKQSESHSDLSVAERRDVETSGSEKQPEEVRARLAGTRRSTSVGLWKIP
jgi:hypothetical protein